MHPNEVNRLVPDSGSGCGETNPQRVCRPNGRVSPQAPARLHPRDVRWAREEEGDHSLRTGESTFVGMATSSKGQEEEKESVTSQSETTRPVVSIMFFTNSSS